MVSIIVIVLIILILAVGGFAWKLSEVVLNTKGPSVDAAIKCETEKGYIDEEWYTTTDREKFNITSSYGYELACELIKSKTAFRGVMILCHGFGFNRAGSLKYVGMFQRLGFDSILYDHRACGESGGKYTTMGMFEEKDLSTVVDYIYSRYGENCVIGTHGESMGSATVLLHCNRDKRINFVISDCGYSDLTEQLAYRLKIEYKLPRFPILYIASFLTKLKANFWYHEVSPITELRKNNGLPEIPILFIHGAEDDYILNKMCYEMFELKQGIKDIYIAKGATHAISYCVNPSLYENRVTEFLEQLKYIS
jgi:fermentation-respiration switch protein FrsA (DUF1100 family)